MEGGGNEVLKDREKLGILDPAELTLANEGAWWLGSLCTCLGRAYTGYLCTFGSVHCKQKLL